MEIKRYEQLDEVLYTDKLENGLTIKLLPKKGFHKTFALFSTDYGSIDNEFIPLGENAQIRVPDGIAHFLEHKLFEKEEGDVFQVFGKYGASANAFTSFSKTAYLFSSTNRVKDNLETLLDFVQEPYFTDKTVEKEKGIIAQEIRMYDDSPDWRLLFGLLENLYPNHPANTDIAGTVDSIQQITSELLYTCYRTFYHPGNMTLTVIGNIDPEEVHGWIQANQSKKEFPPFTAIQRFLPGTELENVEPFRSIEMPVNRPKAIVGIKGTRPHKEDASDLRFRIGMDLLLKMLFGPTSANYLKLYDSGLIDDSFSYEFSYERSFDFLSVGGDTKDPDGLTDVLKEILLSAKNSPEMTEENFELVKKRSIGQMLQAMNSIEYLAHQFIEADYGEANVFDIVPIMEDITLEELQELADCYMKAPVLSAFHILPRGEDQ
ncbi:EF-P 5-aminopentanol modification-associated protein YfmH [Atopococcus tabaci]|uniref:EF-P 5-aminopentanol modification-associated protein YfmH n=1 Tax=Atopococcus tabaci TaxID=269774 RepID=UPI000426ACD3|nr:pitrilysin family protein [Atopococcus tabaci]